MNGMTFKDLQDSLITEIETILKDIQTKDANGNEVEGIKGYAHLLPITLSGNSDPAEYFPYFIVRFSSGETKDDDDCWHVDTDIIIGIHEQDFSMGHEHVLIAIQRIVDRFANSPRIGNFRADQNIQWALQEDDTYPFYFGAVAITFSAPKIGRKAYDEWI